jgi:hypothetical protein
MGSDNWVCGHYIKVAMPNGKGLGFQSFILTGGWVEINGYEALERVRVVESTVDQISYLNKQLATGSVKRVDEIVEIDISTIINQTGNNITYACGEIGSKQIRASFDLEKTIDIMEIGIRGLIPSELSPHKLKESCSEIINKIASDCIILREVKS